MQAIRFEQTGGPEVLKLVEVPKPTAGPNQVVVRNKYAGVNFIDTYFRSGVYPAKLPGGLGQEGAGEIVQVGEQVHDFKVGDPVAYLGNSNTYAEYSAIDVSNVIKVDTTKISLEKAAASLLQGLTAHTLVTRSYQVKPNDWVLVQAGAGGTGRLIIQLAKYLGANVIATVSNDTKAQVALQAGADHIVLYTKESVPEAIKRIVPEGVHVVYDGVGKETYQGSMQSLRRLGCMVSFGNASGTVEPISLLDLAANNLSILRPRLYGYLVTEEERKRHMGELIKLLSEDRLDIQVFKTYGLADAAEAHADLQGRKTTGKLLLAISQE